MNDIVIGFLIAMGIIFCIICLAVILIVGLGNILHSNKELTQKEKDFVENGYAKVSKDGEVYLDLEDPRTLAKLEEIVKKFNKEK